MSVNCIPQYNKDTYNSLNRKTSKLEKTFVNRPIVPSLEKKKSIKQIELVKKCAPEVPNGSLFSREDLRKLMAKKRK